MKQVNKKIEPTHKLPIIAIIGRPNVGKSSLFNRLLQKRIAVTFEVAGTTRDRIYHRLQLDQLETILVDTGGIELGKKGNIEADVQAQAKIAIEDADLILFLVNAREPLTANDDAAVKLLRKSKKPVMFVANKVDTPNQIVEIDEYLRMGFGQPIQISAYHNHGIDELKETIEKTLKENGWKPLPPEPAMIVGEKNAPIKVAIVGKPNVGKSSLVNAIFGKDTLIVSPVAGTTRDAVDVDITWKSQKFTFIDTAGLRRRGRIETGIEKISTLRSLEAIERSDVVCLVVDFHEKLAKQDQHISSYILEAKKGLMLIVNKSDLMEDVKEDQHQFLHQIQNKFDFLPWVPIVFVSALKKQNLEKIFHQVQAIQQNRCRIIDNEELTSFMHEITFKHLPPKVGLIRPKVYSLEQTAINPPTFQFWVNDQDSVHFSYRRYLENELRKQYDFTGTSLNIVYKNKFVKEEKKRR